jgi:hypothetical protein
MAHRLDRRPQPPRQSAALPVTRLAKSFLHEACPTGDMEQLSARYLVGLPFSALPSIPTRCPALSFLSAERCSWSLSVTLIA